ncbi:phosphatase PAP2 family protein [Acidothermaceae bacterium B102]|nr:phosphatase PAP2 family protein [Acidothermaceae bacterium B102]
MTLRKDGPEELAPLDVRSPGPTEAYAASEGGPLRLHWRAVARVRRLRTPRWWEEVLFIGISYALYSTVRNAVPGHSVAAFHRAASVLRLETDLHLDAERPLNKLVASAHWLAYLSSYWYALMHFIVTIGVLIWLYVRHPLRYRPIRTVLYTTNILALGGFWFFALAPPRLLPGFVDTVDKYPTVWGSWDTAGVAKLSNQLAAMPSLHIGWSTWCGLVIFTLARHRTTRILGVAYPLITLFVILGTANHFLLDAVGGLVVLGLSFGIERLLFGRGAFDSPDQVRRAAPWRRGPALSSSEQP